MGDNRAPDIDRARSTWLVGPCDGCGEPMGETGWMRKTGRVDEEHGWPVVEFFCSRPCIPPRNGHAMAPPHGSGT